MFSRLPPAMRQDHEPPQELQVLEEEPQTTGGHAHSYDDPPTEEPETPGCFSRLSERINVLVKKFSIHLRKIFSKNKSSTQSAVVDLDISSTPAPEQTRSAADELTLRGEEPILICDGDTLKGHEATGVAARMAAHNDQLPTSNMAASGTGNERIVVYQDPTNPTDVICQVADDDHDKQADEDEFGTHQPLPTEGAASEASKGVVRMEN